MYGLDPKQFKERIVVPVCRHLDLSTDNAISLTLGTCMKESLLKYVIQLPNGPALGVGQMEPATHDDIWSNFLAFNATLRLRVMSLLGRALTDGRPHSKELISNLAYSVAMVRIHYYRAEIKKSRAFPMPPNDPLDLCHYWKRHYNTPLGKGSVEEALQHFENAVNL